MSGISANAGALGEDLRSVRDQALLAFGMGDASRCSELVALLFADFERVPEGSSVLEVSIRQ